MIQTRSFFITKRIGELEYFVKTAKQKLDEHTITVIWTRTIHKAKRFNRTTNIRKFTQEYKIEDIYITMITDWIMIEILELEDIE